uniref:Wsv308-like protein n=1 Tax=Metapenaeus ensis nimavirus TaxID=2133794 RepID=A0A401IPF7_9VIRU|nr:MAG: wsv308-like protein [Metapenaeus ensis nimavirus]GBG35492.1 wsv308-like protein [Metapenaeus ensis nimavirus]
MYEAILEKYLEATAKAVLAVAQSVEKQWEMEGTQPSVEMAAALSVAMYGAPPKPTAGDIADLLPSHGGRKNMRDASLAEKTVLAMSVARYGIEATHKIAETAAEDIYDIMASIVSRPSPSNVRPYIERTVFIGLNGDNHPIVDCTKYKMDGDETQMSPSMFTSTVVLEEVEKDLVDLFSEVQDPEMTRVNLKSYVKRIATNGQMESIMSWGDEAERKLRRREQPEQSCYHLSDYQISRRATEVNAAVADIMRHVGKSYCSKATQLISAQDIINFQRAIGTCYDALMADTHECIISHVFFYANFKIMEDNPKTYVKEKLGTAAGTLSRPATLKRRTVSEMLFYLCFMFKIMPVDFVGSVLTFPDKGLSYHGRSGTRLGPLLSNYGPRFQESWSLAQGVLQKRRETVTHLTQNKTRVDTLDAFANLTGPVYVLVLAVAKTFQAQRACAFKFLKEIDEQYKLWNKFVQE